MITRNMTVFLLVLILVGMPLTAHSQGEVKAKFLTVSPADLISGAPQNVPILGMITMVDIGAHSCIPCKMMTPVIEELSKEYEGRAAIVFIDVWEHRAEAKKYGIKSIPTQIFYDAEGKEQFRHVGFFDKESIVTKLAELGAK
ncbi:thiol reductase thioredoxin [Pseudodesulfovibrio nedwellii]|uniref:Thiol reductase thioredoxin n=1 Tax=Pseudodesulfovibrio nedwellii TaxID=2973072 RepID=A0ABN6S7H8_9BACT|nr:MULTISPECIES: thioredoxin family protein [Pseudodesulfovibrio]BDQ38057.1 thiol reductase thioredoxin [Pseudodesulfovibrio nedwellii]